MKIACNYYRETEQLLDDGKIDIDYFKYPGLGFQMKIMEDQQTLDLIINNAKFIKGKYKELKFVSIENFDTIEWGNLLKPESITQLIEEQVYQIRKICTKKNL